MGVVLVHAANRHPPDHPGDPESHRPDRRVQRRLARRGLIRTDSPNWQPWFMFFLRALAEQVRRLEKKVEREKIVLAAMPELQLQIVEFTREHGRVTIGEAIKLTEVGRNTLKQHFRVLVERGTLSQHGSGRGVWYDLR